MIRALTHSLVSLCLSAADPNHCPAINPPHNLQEGWLANADQALAGPSFVQIHSISPQKVLCIQANISRDGLRLGRQDPPFAGAIRFLHPSPGHPNNLSKAKTLRFRIKGSGDAEVALFQDAMLSDYRSQTLQLTSSWTAYDLALDSFKLDTTRLVALAFGRRSPGPLDIQIDGIHFQ